MLETPAKILVVDDNPAMAAVISFNLRRSGFDIKTARNGREAWEMAREEAYDLIVTDHQMPEMTGVELCERLREQPQYSDTPIVMLTAKGLEIDLAEMRTTLGISAALPKPFSPAEMVRTVHKCLEEACTAIS